MGELVRPFSSMSRVAVEESVIPSWLPPTRIDMGWSLAGTAVDWAKASLWEVVTILSTYLSLALGSLRLSLPPPLLPASGWTPMLFLPTQEPSVKVNTIKWNGHCNHNGNYFLVLSSMLKHQYCSWSLNNVRVGTLTSCAAKSLVYN